MSQDSQLFVLRLSSGSSFPIYSVYTDERMPLRLGKRQQGHDRLFLFFFLSWPAFGRLPFFFLLPLFPFIYFYFFEIPRSSWWIEHLNCCRSHRLRKEVTTEHIFTFYDRSDASSILLCVPWRVAAHDFRKRERRKTYTHKKKNRNK